MLDAQTQDKNDVTVELKSVGLGSNVMEFFEQEVNSNIVKLLINYIKFK